MRTMKKILVKKASDVLNENDGNSEGRFVEKVLLMCSKK